MASAPDRFIAGAYLRQLAGEDVRTLSGRPNRVIRVDDDYVFIKTDKSEDSEGEPLRVREVQTAADRLLAEGQLLVSEIPHRRSFIAGVLVRLPGVRAERRPARLIYDRYQ